MLRGEFHGSLLDVSLMGNHAEPIMFLVAPIFAAIPHPMTLVAVQAAAMASMPFTAWRICGRLRFGPGAAIALALLTVVNPGSCFIAIHEFHPEAFAAPFLLLLIEARLARNLARFWLWFLICVACKENIALLLVVWGGVFSILDRRCDLRHQWRWNIAPALLAACWVGLYGLWLSPWLNQGRVEYTSLYSHLGNSGSDILTKLFMEPHRAGNALRNGLTKGNLVWGLAVSFAGLPFLRPRWLLIAAPLLLQHVLSSRLWDWSLNYHYAAPLIPLFWIATAEGVAAFRAPEWLPSLPVLASFALQILIGPFRQTAADFTSLEAILWERDWKARLVAEAARSAAFRHGRFSLLIAPSQAAGTLFAPSHFERSGYFKQPAQGTELRPEPRADRLFRSFNHGSLPRGRATGGFRRGAPGSMAAGHG